jgi:hypothetical protein
VSSWGRRAAVAAAALVVLGLLVGAGRWERSREISSQAAGIRKVEALVGPLAPTLSGYRVLPGFDCLVYRRGPNPYALELCVDPAGRVVEAIDRRSVDRKIWSLTFEPASSPVRVDRAEVDRLLARMGAPAT